MLDVFLTIDTEFYPLWPDWRSAGLSRDIDRDIYGRTSSGDFGVGYQLDVLASHNLKACFFVEGLCGSAGAGEEVLRRLVDEIQSKRQEVQLHLHPEWLQWMETPPIANHGRETIDEFTANEQSQLIALAKSNLVKAGASDITAFRAGDFAANRDTLPALRNCGINIDSSYNACYPKSLGDVSALRGADQPVDLRGVWEFPVAVWSDGLGSNRHAQLCSCSSAELEGAILSAWRGGWSYLVIVSHSFELLKKRRKRVADPAPDPIVVRRFSRLCEFLAENSDKFRTRHFANIDLASLQTSEPVKPLQSPAYRTAWRMAEQTRRRLAY
jgi:peptidoglycan/xylan/chitin deacetylase (PgdA/CDA1 family)